MMRSVITLAAVALVAGMIVPRYARQLDAGDAQQARRAPAATGAALDLASDSASVVVPRDGLGHFLVEASVNGQPLKFMIDTGATVIALRAEDAVQLGVQPAYSEYTVVLRTANGLVRAGPATLDTIEIGGIVLHNVEAVVMPARALSENLLGMSFLSRLHHFDYSDGKMVLEQ
ncbi:MAG: TIGR02281 family clan AA aspartic protease [Xanthobacteraceae bacterium]